MDPVGRNQGVRGQEAKVRRCVDEHRGNSTVAVTESYGTVGDDLAKREALRLVQCRAQAQGKERSGEGAPSIQSLSWCAA